MKRDFSREPIHQLERLIRRYIREAAAIADGTQIGISRASMIDGINTRGELAKAIIDCGEAYIAKMQAIRHAAPVVRGNTISVYQREPVPANTPSIEDEAFLSRCRSELIERGFVLAADADTYERIAAAYPGKVHPARVRGAEARRYIELRKHESFVRAVSKRIRKRNLYRE